jgi:hypothetical protein
VDAKKIHQLLTSMVRDWKARFQTVVSFEVFRNELAAINSRLARLEEMAPLRVPIQSLAPEPYDILKPIEAVVQFVDGECVASFFDANLSTGGDTQAEAIFNLKALIVGTFEILVETKDSDLGPGPRQQKAG